jgi:hypothetical protein
VAKRCPGWAWLSKREPRITTMATPMATPGVGLSAGMVGGFGVQRLPPEVNRILYVRNLPFNMSPEELYKIFGDYGAIRQIRMCAPLTPGASRCTGHPPALRAVPALCKWPLHAEAARKRRRGLHLWFTRIFLMRRGRRKGSLASTSRTGVPNAHRCDLRTCKHTVISYIYRILL